MQSFYRCKSIFAQDSHLTMYESMRILGIYLCITQIYRLDSHPLDCHDFAFSKSRNNNLFLPNFTLDSRQISRYCKSLNTFCCTKFACAIAKLPLCAKTLCLLNVALSAAKSTSRISDSAALTFTCVTETLLIVDTS